MVLSPPGAGIIADISTQAERAGFVGLYSLGPLVRTQTKHSSMYVNLLVAIIGGTLSRSCDRRSAIPEL